MIAKTRTTAITVAALALVLQTGCSITDPLQRIQHADALANAIGWQRQSVQGGLFPLTVYAPNRAPSAMTLTVYIEGDGLAWLSADTVSPDPTPLHPVALELALRHPHRAAVYLARPCQFQSAMLPAACRSALWTDARYGQEVIDSINAAVNQLMQRYGARRLVLVGFSGGGAVAALLAARRTDVALLLTVGANLDTAQWTHLQGLSPLAGSLNPADFAPHLASVPQHHWVGADDDVVPPAVLASFAARFPAGARPPVTVVQGYGHACCWQATWGAMVRKVAPSP